VQPNPQQNRVFKVIVVLATIALCEGVVLIWFLLPTSARASGQRGSYNFQQAAKDRNLVREAYPDIDFGPMYPGMSEQEIDELQRECFSLRYVYAPFVEFRPLPAAKKHVNVLEAGYRRGAKSQPWPPRDTDYVVFVFGGSTTFCYGLRDEHTLVAALDNELQTLWPDKSVQCYNFGRGYYFSTQEKIFFQTLLAEGHVPDLAIFIDGLNDFYHADGRTELSDRLYEYTAPDLPKEPVQTPYALEDMAVAVSTLLTRYANNIRMTRVIADEYQVATVFVGQPVPRYRYPATPEFYPFVKPEGHELCVWGYNRFEAAARRGDFGGNFIWCGDAFSEATTPMYADSVHYSIEGAKSLAQTIVKRARQQQLLPGN